MCSAGGQESIFKGKVHLLGQRDHGRVVLFLLGWLADQLFCHRADAASHLETLNYSRPSISTNYGVILTYWIGISCLFHGVVIPFAYNKTEANLVVMARNFCVENGVLNIFNIYRWSFFKITLRFSSTVSAHTLSCY